MRKCTGLEIAMEPYGYINKFCLYMCVYDLSFSQMANVLLVYIYAPESGCCGQRGCRLYWCNYVT